MKKIIVYVSVRGDMRQYRISPADHNTRICNADGYRFGGTHRNANFTLPDVKTRLREQMKRHIGEIGLKFIFHAEQYIKLAEQEQLILVNAWTVIFFSRSYAQGPVRPPLVRGTKYQTKYEHSMDEKMHKVIEKTLGCQIELIEADDPVGAVFL